MTYDQKPGLDQHQIPYQSRSNSVPIQPVSTLSKKEWSLELTCHLKISNLKNAFKVFHVGYGCPQPDTIIEMHPCRDTIQPQAVEPMPPFKMYATFLDYVDLL